MNRSLVLAEPGSLYGPQKKSTSSLTETSKNSKLLGLGKTEYSSQTFLDFLRDRVRNLRETRVRFISEDSPSYDRSVQEYAARMIPDEEGVIQWRWDEVPRFLFFLSTEGDVWLSNNHLVAEALLASEDAALPEFFEIEIRKGSYGDAIAAACKSNPERIPLKDADYKFIFDRYINEYLCEKYGREVVASEDFWSRGGRTTEKKYSARRIARECGLDSHNRIAQQAIEAFLESMQPLSENRSNCTPVQLAKYKPDSTVLYEGQRATVVAFNPKDPSPYQLQKEDGETVVCSENQIRRLRRPSRDWEAENRTLQDQVIHLQEQLSLRDSFERDRVIPEVEARVRKEEQEKFEPILNENAQLQEELARLRNQAQILETAEIDLNSLTPAQERVRAAIAKRFEPLLIENGRLQAENQSLRQSPQGDEVEALRAEVERLSNELKLRAVPEKILNELVQAQDRVKELEAQMQTLQKKKTNPDQFLALEEEVQRLKQEKTALQESLAAVSKSAIPKVKPEPPGLRILGHYTCWVVAKMEAIQAIAEETQNFVGPSPTPTPPAPPAEEPPEKPDVTKLPENLWLQYEAKLKDAIAHKDPQKIRDLRPWIKGKWMEVCGDTWYTQIFFPQIQARNHSLVKRATEIVQAGSKGSSVDTSTFPYEGTDRQKAEVARRLRSAMVVTQYANQYEQLAKQYTLEQIEWVKKHYLAPEVASAFDDSKNNLQGSLRLNDVG